MLSILEVRVRGQRKHQQDANRLQHFGESQRDFWWGAISDLRINLQQPAGVNQEQREDQEEQNPFKKTRSAMTQYQRQQKKVDQRASRKAYQPNIEE